jgi:hypothetical protein
VIMIANAIQHTPPNGRVTVTAKKENGRLSLLFHPARTGAGLDSQSHEKSSKPMAELCSASMAVSVLASKYECREVHSEDSVRSAPAPRFHALSVLRREAADAC